MRLAVTAAVVLLMGAACTGGGPSSDGPRATTSVPRSAPTTAAATTTTLDPTTAAILAAYRASWVYYIAVSETYPVNGLDPRLSMHDTGNELASVRKSLTLLNAEGHYYVGPTDLAPVLISVQGISAIIMDCFFDHSVEVDRHTGKAVNVPDLGHTLATFTMTRIGGSWFVADSTVRNSGTTEDGCLPGRG